MSEDIKEENRLLARRSLERRPAIVFLSGELLAVPIPLERDEVTLGRAIEADIRLNDSRASRLHARIISERNEATGDLQYHVRDLESTNGTFLNGEKITDASLADGDKIQIGENLLRFDLLDEIDLQFQRKIHRLVAHDELTGLLTSKSFFTELRREAARAEFESRPFCLLMMDIDHFKAVNDTHGHLVGSRTLEDVGEVITRALRAGDVGARFGGEEFAAIMLDADLSQGMIGAERVRRDIEDHVFDASRTVDDKDGHRIHHITISIGVANFPDDSRDPIQLVELADTALYRAKRSGRNQVCAYRSNPPHD